MITGKTILIAHLGFPATAFKSPMIYNPYFEDAGIDAVVVPMGVQAKDYPAFLAQLVRLTNLCGALVSMPHKVTTMGLADEVTPTATIAGAANALLKRPDGSLLADMFDGAGFVRGMQRRGRNAKGSSALVVGSGGVGSAIAASLAGPASAGSGSTTSTRHRPKPWAAAWPTTIPTWRSLPARMTRRAGRSSSTRPR